MSSVAWRRLVAEEIQLLSSEEDQIAYEVAVPHVDITAELLSGWFDDVYHPEAEGFTINFTSEELLALARFNSLYELNANELPATRGTVRTWHASSAWQAVVTGARVVKALLAGEA